MLMTPRRSRLVLPAVFCCAVASGVMLRAQSPADQAPASLAGVIAELRQLRASVEESNRRQSHIQMLSVHLSAQQSRLVETAARLDATRRELNDAVLRTREGERVLTMFRGDSDGPGETAFPPEAAGIAGMFKPHVEAARAQEALLRAREAEMRQALDVEQARWGDLIARLEQSVQP